MAKKQKQFDAAGLVSAAAKSLVGTMAKRGIEVQLPEETNMAKDKTIREVDDAEAWREDIQAQAAAVAAQKRKLASVKGDYKMHKEILAGLRERLDLLIGVTGESRPLLEGEGNGE